MIVGAGCFKFFDMSACVYAKPKTSIKLPPTCAHTHTYIHNHVQVQANLQSLQEPEHELADSVGGDAWSALDRGDISMFVHVCIN